MRSCLAKLFSEELTYGRWPIVEMIHGKHKLIEIDRQTSAREINRGVHRDFRTRRTTDFIQRSFAHTPTQSFELGQVVVFGHGKSLRYLGVEVDDRDFFKEVKQQRLLLGEAGIYGFRRALRIEKVEPARLVLARMAEVVPTNSQIQGWQILNQDFEDANIGTPPMSAEDLAERVKDRFKKNGIVSVDLGMVHAHPV